MLGRFQGRNKFAHYRRCRFEGEAVLLSHHGFDSWELVSKIEDETGKFLREDLRMHGAAAIKLSLINETTRA